MEGAERIRCRVAACREPPAGAGPWCFYLINDGDAPLESAELYQVSTEWGDFGHSQAADVRVSGLAPGAHAPIWCNDGEFRIELALLVRVAGREARLTFEFPRLYRQTGLKLVRGLGKPGREVSFRVSRDNRLTLGPAQNAPPMVSCSWMRRRNAVQPVAPAYGS